MGTMRISDREAGSGEREAYCTGTLFDRLTARPLERQRGGRELVVLDERLRGTKFVELEVKSLINTPESTGMGFWSINPYVGCEFGCSYCYARYAHEYVVERAHDRGTLDDEEFQEFRNPRGLEAFEHRVFVKARASVLTALERDLARVRRRAADLGTQNIVIGTATDPYQPAERQYQLTRAVLERLAQERGHRVGIITKSPLVCRDIGLLLAVAGRNHLTVYVSLISTDVKVIKLFEARSPMPHARLRALKRLTAAGIRAGLIVAPILPGITDSVVQIDNLMRAAKEVEAQFVYPSTLRLYPSTREHFLPIVERHFPDLARRYRAAYCNQRNAPKEYVKAVRRRFHRIAGRYGIADTDGGREQPVVERQEEQLMLL